MCLYLIIRKTSFVSSKGSLLPRHLHDERYPDRREMRNLNHHAVLLLATAGLVEGAAVQNEGSTAETHWSCASLLEEQRFNLGDGAYQCAAEPCVLRPTVCRIISPPPV